MSDPIAIKYKQGACPTMHVVSNNEYGYTEISTHEFDPEIHEKYTGPIGKPTTDDDEGPIAKIAQNAGPNGVLLGSTTQPSQIDVGRMQNDLPWPMDLGEVVVSAWRRSKMTEAKWNKLAQDQRNRLIDAEVALLVKGNVPKASDGFK
jgi:hypothetical protein